MNAHISRIGVVILLLAALLVPVIVAAQEPPPAPPQPQTPESEPNDSFYEAEHVALDTLRHGRINPAGDRDVYQMWMYSPVVFSVDVRLPDSSPLALVISIYDRWENLLEVHDCPRSGRCLTYKAPSDEYDEGDLYIVITDADGNAGPQYEYSFIVAVETGTTDPHEPNDFLSEATPYTVGETINGVLAPVGDIDTFAFHLEAGNEVTLGDSNYSGEYFNAAGEFLSSFISGNQIFVAPETGLYYLQITSAASPYALQVRYTQRPIYASFSGAGKLDGVAFQPGDILIYTSLDDTWRMWFRAADYALKGNLAAFDRAGEYTPYLYLTYGTAQNVPGVGAMAPHDVLLYIPGNPEWGTDPTWELVFDGSQLGLTTAAERLDALAVESDYFSVSYHLSTTGQAKLPVGGGQWHLANNDVITHWGYWQGDQWMGNLRGLLSGPANNFGKANVVGLDIDRDTIYLTFDRNLTLDGVALGRGDIVACGRPNWVATCESFTKVFDASDAGVGGYKIDAIDVGVYGLYEAP